MKNALWKQRKMYLDALKYVNFRKHIYNWHSDPHYSKGKTKVFRCELRRNKCFFCLPPTLFIKHIMISFPYFKTFWHVYKWVEVSASFYATRIAATCCRVKTVHRKMSHTMNARLCELSTINICNLYSVNKLIYYLHMTLLALASNKPNIALDVSIAPFILIILWCTSLLILTLICWRCIGQHSSY